MRRAVVKDVDLGFAEIQKQIASLDGSYVLVGFQEGTKTKGQVKGQRQKKAGLSMAAIAATNEFGTNRIPARPFMSTSFDENRAKINKAIQGEYAKILDGKSTASKSLGLIGLLGTRLIVQKIRAIISPPNSPITIAIKGSSKPLIDFGQMVQSVRHKVVIK
jgi:hypothetical protein